jgi:hypothetical protein
VTSLENAEDEDKLEAVAGAEAGDNLITLDPDDVEDLEEELIETGLSPKAVGWIVSKVPD